MAAAETPSKGSKASFVCAIATPMADKKQTKRIYKAVGKGEPLQRAAEVGVELHCTIPIPTSQLFPPRPCAGE